MRKRKVAFAKKNKRSKDGSKCCEKCNFFDNRNQDDPICSLTGFSTKGNLVCANLDTTSRTKCQMCGDEMKYSSKEEMYNDTHLFQMVSGSGSSTGQRIHLCHKCAFRAWEMFDEFLESLRGKQG